METKKYLGHVINRERTAQKLNQKDLSRGICTISYLSKIETGKADPSDEILKKLFDRLGLVLDEKKEKEAKELTEKAYDLLFSGMNDQLNEFLADKDIDQYRSTSSALDLLLLRKLMNPDTAAVQMPDDSMVNYMDGRQLALYHLIQGKPHEAVLCHPNAYMYLQAGLYEYRAAKYDTAIDNLKTAYDLACRDGYCRIMLQAKQNMGNCYSIMLDMENMNKEYQIAKNLAAAMHDDYALSRIDYCIAYSRIESGNHEEAYQFFSIYEPKSKLSLMMLAISCEMTGRIEEGIAALDLADTMTTESIDNAKAVKMCHLVRYRLEHRDYLERPAYGQMLKDCYHNCLIQLPMGYLSFHLGWLLEWYEATRQYKKAYELLRNYPAHSLARQY